MKQRNVFLRAWDYLKHYRSAVFLSLFYTVFAAIMNVLEPYVLGLIMTEITQNVTEMMQGVPGAGINYRFILIWLVIYFFRGLLWQTTTYGSNYYITEAVQGAMHYIRRDLNSKLNKLPV